MEDTTRIRIDCRDGVTLALRHLPAEAARGVCVMGHAMMTNRRTLDVPYGRGLGSTLQRAGFHTYLLDLRGHGESSRGCDWTYDDLVQTDLPAVLRELRRRHPGLPVMGVGHSLMGGGLLAFQGLTDSGLSRPDAGGFSALVTLCTNIWLPQLDSDRARLLQKWVMAQGFGVIASALGRFPARSLRMGGEDVAQGFATDVARWTRHGRWDARDGTEYLAALRAIRAPVLALFTSGDRVFCHPEAGLAFHRHLPPDRLKTRVVGPRDVGFSPGHMSLLLDGRARPIWDDIATWLQTHVQQSQALPAT